MMLLVGELKRWKPLTSADQLVAQMPCTDVRSPTGGDGRLRTQISSTRYREDLHSING